MDIYHIQMVDDCWIRLCKTGIIVIYGLTDK